MTIQCPNCGGSVDDSGVESAYRADHESHQPVWVIGDAVICTHCEIGLGRTRSNDPDHQRDWDFHRASNLEIGSDLTESDVDAAKSKLSRYPSMARELDAMLAAAQELRSNGTI